MRDCAYLCSWLVVPVPAWEAGLSVATVGGTTELLRWIHVGVDMGWNDAEDILETLKVLLCSKFPAAVLYLA